MQKIRIFCKGRPIALFLHTTNWLQIMRTSVVLFMSVCVMAQLLIAAPGHGQDKTKKPISLDYHNAAFSTVVKAIEQKSGLIIMYELTPAIERQQVTIAVQDKSVAEVLDLLVDGRMLQWSLKESDNIVRLERMETPASPAGGPLSSDPPRLSGIIKDAQ